MARKSRYPDEVRERAVRLVFEQQGSHSSQWAAIRSIAEKMGCTAEALRTWVRRAETNAGKRPGLFQGQVLLIIRDAYLAIIVEAVVDGGRGKRG